MQKILQWKSRFFSLLIGQSISLLTSSTVQIAVIWHITDITGSALILSIAGLAAFLPQGIMALFAGAFIDRWNKKRVMIVSDALIALVCIIIFLVAQFMRLYVWLIIAMLAIRSIITAFHSPAFLALTPAIVPEDNLLKCAGYSQTFSSISMILSPVIAASLFAALQVQFILLVDVIGAIIAIGILLLNKLPANKTTLTKKSVLSDIYAGFRVIKKQKTLIYLTIIGVIFSLLYIPISVMYPLMSLDWFGGTKWEAGYVEMLFALGLMVGGILLSFTNNQSKPMAYIHVSILIMGILLLASGLLPPSAIKVFMALNFLFGAVVPFFSGTQTALIQKSVPHEYLGRVFSVVQCMATFAMAIGLSVSGAFAEIIGINFWFAITGILILLLFAVSLVISQRIKL